MTSPDLPLIVLGGVTVCSLAVNVWLEHRFCKRDTELRRKLGASRTALEASQIERDNMRRQFNAQAVELARYRGREVPERRLTRVFTGLPPDPEPDDAA